MLEYSAYVDAARLRRRLLFMGLGGGGVTSPTGSASSSIRAEIQDPSPGVTSMGGKLVFSTSSSGSTDLADRMVIDNQVCPCPSARILFLARKLCNSSVARVFSCDPTGSCLYR
jgi:hypothetical protein